MALSKVIGQVMGVVRSKFLVVAAVSAPLVIGFALLKDGRFLVSGPPGIPDFEVRHKARGRYIVDWNGNRQSFEDTYVLQETADGGGTWITIASNVTVMSKQIVKAADGEYGYRLKHCFTPLPGSEGKAQMCSAFSEMKRISVRLDRDGEGKQAGIAVPRP